MKISVNCLELHHLAGQIAKLKADAFHINDCLSASVGTAAETEKEIISQLIEICLGTIPSMLDNTCSLLTTIANDFEKMDKELSVPKDEELNNKPSSPKKPFNINDLKQPPRSNPTA